MFTASLLFFFFFIEAKDWEQREGTPKGGVWVKACCLWLVTQSYPALRPHRLQPARLLCPWEPPGKNTRVGCHALLQGIFPTQGLNPGLLHCRLILYRLSYKGSPFFDWVVCFSGIELYELLVYFGN